MFKIFDVEIDTDHPPTSIEDETIERLNEKIRLWKKDMEGIALMEEGMVGQCEERVGRFRLMTNYVYPKDVTIRSMLTDLKRQMPDRTNVPPHEVLQILSQIATVSCEIDGLHRIYCDFCRADLEAMHPEIVVEKVQGEVVGCEREEKVRKCTIGTILSFLFELAWQAFDVWLFYKFISPIVAYVLIACYAFPRLIGRDRMLNFSILAWLPIVLHILLPAMLLYNYVNRILGILVAVIPLVLFLIAIFRFVIWLVMDK